MGNALEAPKHCGNVTIITRAKRKNRYSRTSEKYYFYLLHAYNVVCMIYNWIIKQEQISVDRLKSKIMIIVGKNGQGH